MSISRATRHTAETIASIRPGIGRLVLRRFDPRRDSWEALTRLLHRAFERLATLGMHCACADQDARASAGGRLFRGDLQRPHRRHAHDGESR